MIIIKLIKCEVATWERSVFSFSAKIINGPKAPGAAENIEAFLLYPENFWRYFATIRMQKII